MEVRVRERLIGALVLVAIVVLLVPAVLKGRDPGPQQPAGQETRSVEVLLDDEEPPDQEEVLVPETLATERPEPRTPVAEPPRPVAAAPAAPDAAREAAKPQTRTAIAEPIARAPVEATAWAVQLGAFATRDKAESLVADLRRRGYAAFVLEYRASGKVLHRVRVGPEQDRERAAAIAERLQKDGFEPVVARHP